MGDQGDNEEDNTFKSKSGDTNIDNNFDYYCNYYSNVNLIFIGLNGSVGRLQCPEENKTGKMNFLNKPEYTPKPSSFQ